MSGNIGYRMRRYAEICLLGMAIVMVSQQASAVTADNVVCAGCVGTGDLANNSVTTTKVRNYAITSAKIAPQVTIGSSSTDGKVLLRNRAGAKNIQLYGVNGHAIQKVTATGFVKAWAQINADGTVRSCYKCNKNATQTRRLTDGGYEVDFSPLSTNIAARPRSANIDANVANTNPPQGMISLADRSGDASSIWVDTSDASGNYIDRPFTIIIY